MLTRKQMQGAFLHAARPLARLVMALVFVAGAPALAQREFVEEIEPDDTKKSSLDKLDLDTPDVARPKPVDPKATPEKTPPPPDAGPAPATTKTGAPASVDAGPAGASTPDQADATAPGGPDPAGQGITVLQTSRDAFLEKWDARGVAVRKGETARAKKLIPTLEEALLDFGIQGLPRAVQAPAASAALIREAHAALEDGNIETAQALVDVAQRAAPDIVAVYTAQALVAWRAGDVGKTLDGILEAIRAHGRDPLSLTAVGARALFALGATLLVIISLLALLVGFRGLRYLAFDVATFLPKGAHPGQVFALVAVAALAPFFLGVGPVLAALFLLSLTWMYLERNERIVVSILGVLFVGAPFGLSAYAELASYAGSRADRAQRALTSIDAEGERRAIAALDPAARTAMETGALAMAAKREGRLDDARKLFDDVIAKHGDDPAIAWVHGEAGVLAALREDEETALKELGKATASDPRLAAAGFNSSMIHFRAGRTDKAEAAVNALVQDSPELLSGFRRTTYRAPDQAVAHNRAFIDVMPAALDSIRDSRADGADAAAVEMSIARTFLRGQTGQRALGVLGAFPLAFLLAFGLRRKLRPARACVRCGDPACARLDGAGVPEDTCSQCFHVFVSTRSRIDAGVKLRKERAIMRRARRIERVVMLLSLVLPGSGHLVCGAAVRGTVLVGLWTLGLCALGFALDAWPMPRLAGPISPTVGIVAAGVFCVVVWIVSFRSSFVAAADAVSTRRK